MKRRKLLNASAAIGLAGLAGCVERVTAPLKEIPGLEDESTGFADLPRVDDPPHTPEEPPMGDWDGHYLGEGMSTESDLEFEVLEQVGLAQRELSLKTDTRRGFAATLIDSAESLEAYVDRERTAEEATNRLEAIDFEEEAVLLVESGFGSSSVRHAWTRLEVGEVLHLHGYYISPFIQTDDWTMRHSFVLFDRPADAFEAVGISLTINEDTRVNFATDEGRIWLEQDEVTEGS